MVGQRGRSQMGSVLRGICICLIAFSASYAVDGELDRTFGESGVVAIGSSGGPPFVLKSLDIQPDGRIVAAGSGVPWGSPFGALLRVLADGTPDVSFGQGNGLEVVTQIGAEPVREYRGLVLQGDGRIVVTGDHGSGAIVTRHEAGGAIDASFGSGGVVVLGGSLAGGSLNGHPRLQPDGRIVVGGGTASSAYAFLARLDANGALDPTFDGDGIAMADFPSGSPRTTDQIVLPDGKVVASIEVARMSEGSAAATARFTAVGAPDTTFEQWGYPDSIWNPLQGLALQPDGKLLGGWTTPSNGSLVFAVRRFEANGLPDAAFGSGGYTLAEAAGGVPTAVLLQGDGKIVVGGTVDGDPTLVRFLPDGTLDESFCTDGIARAGIGTILSPATLYDLALQPDGRIVGAGTLDFTQRLPDPLGM